MILQPTKFLKFPDNINPETAEDLSAIACLPNGYLMIGGDEGHIVEVLKPKGDDQYSLDQTLILVEDQDQKEVDLEDICCVGLTCYAVGSHSRKRKKTKLGKEPDEHYSRKDNRKRLFKAPKPEPTRAVLYRLNVDAATSHLSVQDVWSLEDIIAGDELLEQFIKIPSKENGIDIEGLAIKDDKLYVGFRSPVLRDNYVPILVLNIDDFRDYELRFIQMGGRGVRAITEIQSGFLILGGPPGDGDSSYDIYLWDGKDMIPGDDVGAISPLPKLGTLPSEDGKAEGLAVISEVDDKLQVLVVYDGIKGGRPTLFDITL